MSGGRLRKWAPWVVLGFGFLLRLGFFLSDQSLWLDEAFLAVSFHDRSLSELLRPPLEYGHVLPGGYLAATWLSVQLLGYNDLALRLFPFLCGVGTLALAYPVARAYLAPAAVPWAVALFSLCTPLVVYSGMVKQYSTDVTVSLGLLLITARVLPLRGDPEVPPPEGPWMLAYALAGVVAVWLSLPAVFILAAVGGTGLVIFLREGSWGRAARLGMVCLVWAGNWLFFYAVVKAAVPADQPPAPWAVQFWREQDAFMPAPFTVTGVTWLAESGLLLFSRAADLRLPIVAAALSILGCLALPRRTLAVFWSPIVLCALASGLERYPFYGRVILFLVPSILLMVASGIGRLPWRPLQPLVIAVMIWIPYVGRWHPSQEIKPCLRLIEERWTAGDRIYVYHWAEPAFRYYAPRFRLPSDGKLINPIPRNAAYIKDVDARRLALGLSPVPPEEATVIWGVAENLEPARVDLEKLRGRGRVWLLFTHHGTDRVGYDGWAAYLDKLGHQREAYGFPGSALFLYEF